jgi:hypothetical protein
MSSERREWDYSIVNTARMGCIYFKERFFMKKKVLMSLVLLAIIGTSAVFAQAPTLDKLELHLGGKADSQRYEARAANRDISGAVVIPAKQNNIPVTSVDGFNGCKDITSVTIPEGVTSIGTWGFRGCTNLTSITIPASVGSIASYAFQNCSKLTSVTFKSGATKLSISSQSPFDGDLYVAYQAGGAGTYTRSAGGKNWVKQGGAAVCPTCGQPLPPGFKLQ